MAKSNILVGFEGLSKKQAAALLEFGEEHGLKATKGEKAESAGTNGATAPKKRGPGRPPKSESNSEIILPRTISNAAKQYGAEYGADARKAVLNHFGATTVQGANGLKPEDYPQVLAIFKAGEEFQPSDVEAASDDGKKKKKDKKKDKKSKAEKEEVVEDSSKKKDKKKDKKKKKDK